MNKMGAALVMTAVMSFGVLVTVLPTRAETLECTAITSLPYTIATQGNYCLTGHLNTAMTSGYAIEITTNNVTLDLNGYKIGGLAAGLGTTAIGVHADQRQNITIRNGIIRGFRMGISLTDTPPYTTSQGHLVEDIVADQNTFIGIEVYGQGDTIRRNQVIATGGATSGVYVYAIVVTGAGNDILDNRVAGTAHTAGSIGIYLYDGDGSVVEGNRINGDLSGTSAHGILISSSSNVLVVDNRITTADSGIFFSQTSDGKYMGNLTSGVTTPLSGGTAVGTNN